MIEGFVYLDRVKTQEEFEHLKKLSSEDDHGVFAPNFSVKRSGSDEPLGWFSVHAPGVPIILAWLSTKKIRPRESFLLVNQVENYCSMNGAFAIAFPIPKHSPFYPLMESMGFKDGGEYTFWIKEFK